MPTESAPRPARFDADAERAVLASCLLRPDAFAVAAAIIRRPEWFFVPAHAETWRALTEIARRGEPTHDVVLVAHELRRVDRLQSVGGTDFLASITDTIPTTAHLDRHARIVADHALARAVQAAAQESIAFVDDGHTGVECVEHATKRLLDSQAGRVEDRTMSMADAIEELWQEREAALDAGRRTPAYPTGLADLDRITAGGLWPGQLVIIAGRPGTGKSALAMHVALNVARSIGRVLFVSLEMPRSELVQRLMASEARIDLQRVRTQMLTQADNDALVAAAARIHPQPIEIDDTGRATILDIRGKALRAAVRGGKLAMIVVDYLQLMEGVGEKRDENREREVASISRGLKQLAKELSIPIVALCQLNRGPEARAGDKRPRLSDLRESGAIEQDADVVVFVYRDELYHRESKDRGVAELIVAKQRNGGMDTARVRFIRELTKFEDLAQDEDSHSTSTYGSAPAHDHNWQDGSDA